MISSLLSDRFLSLIPSWHWGAVSFGFSKSFLTSRQVRLVSAIIAEENPVWTNDPRVIQLIESGESDPILHLLDSLAAEAGPSPEGFNDFWARVTLSALGTNLKSLADPLGIVEAVYSELDYPKVMAQFVRYMPCEGSNSEEDILDRLEGFAKKAEFR